MATRRSFLPFGTLLALLLGAVIIPAVLSISVGIVALALRREAVNVTFGVLVLAFAALSVVGGFLAILFVRRSARLADMQTEFVANVSHELRTPLAGIRLLIETLRKGRAQAPEARDRVLERLAIEEQRLEQLVERILQWRRLDAGLSGGPHTRQSVATLVSDAISPLELRGPALEIDIDDDLPPVEADRPALVGALRNLVDNAVKFSGDAGPVELRARRTPSGVVVEVSDHGPGIAPSETKRIFDRFYRSPAQRRHPGTGLGLAIAKRVVEMHKGRLDLKSAPGKGSTFSIHLPAVKDDGEGDAG